MSDMIDRQAAIKAADSIIERDTSGNNDVVKAMTAWKEYIKALPSAQPGCEDAVSRFKVLRLIDYSSHDLNDAVDNRYMQNEIKQLPSVTPKQRWIPCSERLPEKGKYVLCQCRAGIMDVLRLTDDNGWYKDSTHIYMHGFVLAWMPLPKPWGGGQDG